MKKSFKKAGAAVLSMAMLLSMGAISLPVYAEGETDPSGQYNTSKPASVTVRISGLGNTGQNATAANLYLQGEGARDDVDNGDGSDSDAKAKVPGYSPKYDYWNFNSGEGLEGAKVTMYRIAKLTSAGGWQWENYISSFDSTEHLASFVDFEDLMKNKDGSGDDSDITEEKEFNTSSKTLQEMASYFERAIEHLKADANSTSATHETSATTLADVTVSERTFTDADIRSNNGVELVATDVNALDTNGDGVLSDAEMAKTQNVIGYYLIVTETEQSGAVVQPVLLCLKNGEHKYVAVKGTSITFEKTMTGIESGDENRDKGSDRYLANQKSGLVEQDDVVKFKIVTKIPKYDPNVKSGSIENFTVNDIASEGLYLDIFQEDGTTIDPDKFNVYLVDDVSKAQSAGWTLQGDTVENVGDYKLTVGNTDTTNHTFSLKLSGYQMREADTRQNVEGNGHARGDAVTRTVGTGENQKTVPGDGVVDDVDLITTAGSTAPTAGDAGSMSKTTKFNPDKNKGNYDSMEGMYMVIEYQALVNKTDAGAGINGNESQLGFDRAFNDYIDMSGLTADMVAAVGEVPTSRTDGYTALDDINKQVLRVQLMNGETRYNRDIAAADYAPAAFSGDNMSPAEALTLATVLKAGLEQAKGNAITDSADGIAALLQETPDENGKGTSEGNYYRILARLALDKYNLKLNGEYNTANMTYGSRYATGGGQSQLNTDYSKVYSTDFTLSKFIEIANLEGTPTVPYTATGVGKFAQSNMDKEVTIDNTATADPTDDTVTVSLAALQTYDEAKAGDVAKAMVAAEKTLPATAAAVDAALGTSKPYGGSGQPDNFDAWVASYSTRATSADFTGLTFDTDTANSNAQKAYALYVMDNYNDAVESSAAYVSAAALTVDTLAAEAVDGKIDRVTGDELDPQPTAVVDQSFYNGLNAAQQNLAAYMAKAANDAGRGTGTSQYEERYDEEAVVGAVFHITREYVDNNSIDLGYAVSDANGQLNRLVNVVELASGETAPTRDGYTLYTFPNEDNTKTLYGYVPSTGAAQKWSMVDIGTYKIAELSVPTGYKKWANPVTFTVTADKDTDGDYLETDAFTGEFAASSVYTPKADALASSGLTSIEELRSNVGTVTFDYDKTTGTLSHKMYNEYLDQLPATGGMGTVLFTAGGIAVILMAGALFVVYMKKRNAEEEE